MNVVSTDLLGQKTYLITNSFKGTSGIESAAKSEKFIQLVHSPRPPKKRNFYIKKFLYSPGQPKKEIYIQKLAYTYPKKSNNFSNKKKFSTQLETSPSSFPPKKTNFFYLPAKNN